MNAQADRRRWILGLWLLLLGAGPLAAQDDRGPRQEDPLSSPDPAVRLAAHRKAAHAGGRSSSEYYREVLEADPRDENAMHYLRWARGLEYRQVRVPWVGELEQRLREEFAEEPDAQMAFNLAGFVANHLEHAALCWAWATEGNPDVGIPQPYPIADPAASLARQAHWLGEALRLAEEGSALRARAGIALAKTQLLRGDWKAMNQTLVALGQAPIDLSLRPLLHAPPTDWSDLAAHWGSADETLRSGTCGLILRVEHEGKGVAGVQVLLKPREATMGFKTGIQADTLFFGPQALDPTGSKMIYERTYGYPTPDIARTRFGVSDEEGFVILDRLPETRMVLEVLVPAGLLEDAGTQVELWTQVDGAVQRIGMGAGAPDIGFQLKAGTTTACSLLELRDQRRFLVEGDGRADAEDFVLRWEEREGAPSHDVELALSLLSSVALDVWSDPLVSRRTRVEGASWPLAERGVDGLRLVPGNAYRVEAFRTDGFERSLDHVAPSVLWVPWTHRPTEPPCLETWRLPFTMEGSALRAPPDEGLAGEIVGLTAWIAAHPEAFEVELARLARAWWSWRAGDAQAAGEELRALRAMLPEHAVVRCTAEALLLGIEQGEDVPDRLKLVGPR